MRLTFKNPVSFKNLIQLLSSINEEAFLIVGNDHIVINTIDPSRVIFVYSAIKKQNFLDYDTKGYEVGDYVVLPVDKMKKIVTKIKADSELTMNIDPSGFIEFVITKPFRWSIKLPQISDELPSVEPAKLPFTAGGTVYSAVFQEALDIIRNVTNEVMMEVKEENNTPTLRIFGEGSTSEAEIRLDSSHDWVEELWLEEPSIACYGFSWLKNIFRPLGKSTLVEFMFGTDMPLYVGYTDNDGFETAIYLAPRIREE